MRRFVRRKVVGRWCAVREERLRDGVGWEGWRAEMEDVCMLWIFFFNFCFLGFAWMEDHDDDNRRTRKIHIYLDRPANLPQEPASAKPHILIFIIIQLQTKSSSALQPQ